MISSEESIPSMNPLIDGIPFGREPVLRKVFDRLSTGDGKEQGAQSFSLHGPLFIGKSTILRSLMKPTVQKHFQLDTSSTHLTFFDCNELPPNRLDVFKAFGIRALETSREQWQISINDSLADNLKTLSCSSEWNELTISLESILKILSEQYDRNLVYVLDNFDRLLSLFTASDIQFMRDIFTNTKNALVVSTPRSISQHAPKSSSSQFPHIFLSYGLTAFTEEQSLEFLKRKMDDNHLVELDIPSILGKTGTHPHFLHTYIEILLEAHHEISETAEDVSSENIDAAVKSRLNQDFVVIWQNIDRELQNVLIELCHDERREREYIKELQRLEGEHGIVYRTKDGHFRIMGEFFKEFILSQSEIVNHLLKTNYYRAGLKTLDKLQDEQYYCPFAEMVLTLLNFRRAECRLLLINRVARGCGFVSLSAA